MHDDSARIFSIGFQKIGISFRADAQPRLGYGDSNVKRTVNDRFAAGMPESHVVAEEVAIRAMRTHEVIQNSSATLVYAALDRAYTGSKFILTTYSFGNSVESYGKFFPDRNNALCACIYGTDRLSGNGDLCRTAYDRQTAKIRAHFANRPGDLLEKGFACGDGWFEPMHFLVRDQLPRFPHLNTGGQARANSGRARRMLRSRVGHAG